jgi:hypothetical protein
VSKKELKKKKVREGGRGVKSQNLLNMRNNRMMNSVKQLSAVDEKLFMKKKNNDVCQILIFSKSTTFSIIGVVSLKFSQSITEGGNLQLLPHSSLPLFNHHIPSKPLQFLAPIFQISSKSNF